MSERCDSLARSATALRLFSVTLTFLLFITGQAFGLAPSGGWVFTRGIGPTATVWTGSNGAGDQSYLYDPRKSSEELTWSDTAGTIQGVYTLSTGEWSLTKAGVSSVYNPTTRQWQLDGQGDIWTFNRTVTSNGITAGITWTNGTSGEVWTYNPEDNRWTESVLNNRWEYNVDTGLWTVDVNGSSWQFDCDAQDWVHAGTGPTGTISPMPPRPLIGSHLLEQALILLARDGALSTSGPWGWEITNNSDGTFTGLTSDQSEQLLYNPNGVSSVFGGIYRIVGNNNGPELLRNNKIVWGYNPIAGDWSWENKQLEQTVIGKKSWSYTKSSGEWSGSGEDTWKWVNNIRWEQKDNSSFYWEYSRENKTWTDGVTVWAFHRNSGNWIDQTNDNTYYYDFSKQSWKLLTGAGTIVNHKPALVVTQYEVMQHAADSLCRVGTILNDSLFAWNITQESATKWTGAAPLGDGSLVYESTLAEKQLSGSAYNGKIVWEYTPKTSGNWTFKNSISGTEKIYNFTGSDRKWQEEGADDYWVWVPASGVASTSSSFVSGSAPDITSSGGNKRLGSWVEYIDFFGDIEPSDTVWSFNRYDGTWINDTGDVWSYNEKTGLWNAHDQTEWAYLFGSESWKQINGTSGTDAHMPPLPVVQQVILADSERTIAHAGHGAESEPVSMLAPLLLGLEPGTDWSWTEQNTGIWSGISGAGDQKIIYDPSKSEHDLIWSDSRDRVSLRVTLSTGDSQSWTVTRDGYASMYSASSGEWSANSPGGSSDTWVYTRTVGDAGETVSARWKKGVSETSDEIWTYNPETQKWTDSIVGDSWSYSVETGLWTADINGSNWFYDPQIGAWMHGGTGPQVVLSPLPPRPLAEAMVCESACASLRTNGLLGTSGPWGWVVTDQSNGLFTGVISDGSEQFTYDPDGAPYRITGKNNKTETLRNGTITWGYNPITGSWKWTNSQQASQVAGKEIWTFDADSNEWSGSNESTWKWVTNNRWEQDSNSTFYWEYDQESNQWTDGVTVWTINYSTGLWTDQTNSVTYQYNFSKQSWKKVLGSGAEAVNKPARVVLQYEVMRHMYRKLTQAGSGLNDSLYDWSITHEEPQRWVGHAPLGDGTIIYDKRLASKQVSGLAHNGGLSWSYTLNDRSWEWKDSLNGTEKKYQTTLSDSTSSQSNQAVYKWNGPESDDYWEFSTENLTWAEYIDFDGEGLATDVTWQYSRDLDQWRDDTGAIWSYNVKNGRWKHHGAPTEESYWFYQMSTNKWHQVLVDGTTEKMIDTKPPLPVIQQMIISDAERTLVEADAFAVTESFGWAITKQSDSLWEGSSQNSKRTVTCDCGVSGFSLVSRGEERDSHWKYNPETGDWIWRSDGIIGTKYTAHYTGSSRVWSQAGTSENWELSFTGKTWTNQADTTQIWEQVSGTESAVTWRDSKSDVTWIYTPVNGIWTRQSDMSTWICDSERGAVIPGGSHPIIGGGSVIPAPLVQQTVISDVIRILRAVDGTESVFPHGWEVGALTGQPEGVLGGRDHTNTYTTLYTPGEGDTLIAGESDGQFSFLKKSLVWEFSPGTGNWTVTDQVDRLNKIVWTFTFTDETGTGVFVNDAGTEHWVYTRGDQKWVDQNNTDTIWSWDRRTGLWSDNGSTPVYWLWKPETGIWKNENTEVEYYYDYGRGVWRQATDGVVIDSTGMPPQGLVQMELMTDQISTVISKSLLSGSHLLDWVTLADTDASGIWSGENSAGNYTLTYDTNASDDHIILAHATQPYSFTYDYLTGQFAQSNKGVIFREKSSVFDPATKRWAANGETDRYWQLTPGSGGARSLGTTWAEYVTVSDNLVPSLKSWQLTATGWERALDLSCWHYERTTGVWRRTKEGAVTSEWIYDMFARVWSEKTDTGQSVLFPPQALVEWEHRNELLDDLQAAGSFSFATNNSWSITPGTGDQSGMWTGAHGTDGQSFIYDTRNPQDNGSTGYHLVWESGDKSQKFSYNHQTGDWKHENKLDPLAPSENRYNAATGRFTEGATGTVWIYNSLGTDTGRQSWEQEGGSQVWTFDTASQSWNETGSGLRWEYQNATGQWKRVSTGDLWEYNQVQKQWSSVTHGAAVPALFPPVVISEREMVKSVIDALRADKVFSYGRLTGWSLADQEDGTWGGCDQLNRFKITYDVNRIYRLQGKRVITGSEAGNAEWNYNTLTGDWTWKEASDLFYPQVSRYNAMTQEWSIEGSSQRWRYDPVLYTWTKSGESSESADIWDYNENTGIWGHNGTSWQYDTLADQWVNLTDTTRWEYDLVRKQWAEVTSTGAVIEESSLPIRPVIEQSYFEALFKTVMLSGAIASDQFHGWNFTPGTNGGDWEADSISGDGHLLYPLGEDSIMTLKNTDGSRRVTYNLVTGNWKWENRRYLTNSKIWRFDQTENKWSDEDNADIWLFDKAAGRWSEQKENGRIWEYNGRTNQWHDSIHERDWAYNPDQGLWNLVGSVPLRSWSYNDAHEQWVEQGTPGAALDGLPPRPVRQAALIFTLIAELQEQGGFSTNGGNRWEFTQDGSGHWRGDTSSHDERVMYDPSRDGGVVSWQINGAQKASQGSISWEFMPKKNEWSVVDRVNRFVTRTDRCTRGTGEQSDLFIWSKEYSGREGISSADSWTYTPATRQWYHANPERRWEPVGKTGRYKELVSGSVWIYKRERNVWIEADTGVEMRYDQSAGRWKILAGTTTLPAVRPPVPLVEQRAIERVYTQLIGSGVLSMDTQTRWEYQGSGRNELVGHHANGTIRYRNTSTQTGESADPYRMKWASRSAFTSLKKHPEINTWEWDREGESPARWKFDGTSKLWSPISRADGDDVSWAFTEKTEADGPRWTNQDDASDYWELSQYNGQSISSPVAQSEKLSNIWRSGSTGIEWRYSRETGNWITASGVWLYSFDADAWALVSGDDDQSMQMPPRVLIQDLFIASLEEQIASVETSPLYHEAARAAEHPLYGERPLASGSRYRRYNSSSVLIDNTLTLDGVTWVHTDITRDHRNAFMPSHLETPLPAIIGGERTGEISLINSDLALHEPLVSSGVHWTVHEKSIVNGDPVQDADNRSFITSYNRGSKHDGSKNRGRFFQLGTLCDRYADGSAREQSGSLSVYRSAVTPGITSSDEQDISLTCRTKGEAGVTSREKAVHGIFLTNGAHVMLGWPTERANSQSTPREYSQEQEAADVQANTELFQPFANGRAALDVAGDAYYFGAADSNGQRPGHPASVSSKEGLFIIGSGGELRTSGSGHLLLDTLCVRTLASTEEGSGAVISDSDQLDHLAHGHIEPYRIDMNKDAQSTGSYTGQVLLEPRNGDMSISADQLDRDVPPVK